MTDCSTNPESTTTETKPTTTEESPTTPEESPTTLEPDPYATEFNYVVINEKTHVACIAANMTIFMKIPYETKESRVRIYLFERSSTLLGAHTIFRIPYHAPIIYIYIYI